MRMGGKTPVSGKEEGGIFNLAVPWRSWLPLSVAGCFGAVANVEMHLSPRQGKEQPGRSQFPVEVSPCIENGPACAHAVELREKPWADSGVLAVGSLGCSVVTNVHCSEIL